jgi:hypothetical protein
MQLAPAPKVFGLIGQLFVRTKSPAYVPVIRMLRMAQGTVSLFVRTKAIAQSMDAALRDALHSDYADLDQQTITYLRHEYLR